MLYLVATPIGNLEDISQRALKILRAADVILAEDTRHTGVLLKHFDIPHKPMLSYYDQVESEKVQNVILLAQEQSVVLVSDAGTPLISDPGYKLVREAISQGIKVEAIPGPSAALTALVLSGLPPDKFVFLGFPPEKRSHQEKLFRDILEMGKINPFTYILYVSPYKLMTTLEIVEKELGNIDIVLASELTKIFEKVWRGKVSEAKVLFSKPKGEWVLLWHN